MKRVLMMMMMMMMMVMRGGRCISLLLYSSALILTASLVDYLDKEYSKGYEYVERESGQNRDNNNNQ